MVEGLLGFRVQGLGLRGLRLSAELRGGGLRGSGVRVWDFRQTEFGGDRADNSSLLPCLNGSAQLALIHIPQILYSLALYHI